VPNITKELSVAANSIVDNVISGSQYEFANKRRIMSMGITAAAAGMLCNINSGGDVVAESFSVPVKATYPIIPDEMYYNDAQERGDRLSVPVQNTTGGAITVRVQIQFQDLE